MGTRWWYRCFFLSVKVKAPIHPLVHPAVSIDCYKPQNKSLKLWWISSAAVLKCDLQCNGMFYSLSRSAKKYIWLHCVGTALSRPQHFRGPPGLSDCNRSAFPDSTGQVTITLPHWRQGGHIFLMKYFLLLVKYFLYFLIKYFPCFLWNIFCRVK